jgi:hypothetical protein
MKYTSIFIATLSLFASGCAMDRLVDVTTSRIEVASANSNGLTATNAVEVFRDVANKLGFIVKGPIQDPRTPNEFEFSACALDEKPANDVHLSLMANDKHMSFISTIYGTPKDFVAAQQAASLFEQALDKRGIQYKTTARRSGIFPLND